MAKQLPVNPADVRKSGTIELGSIPVNTYDRTIQEEVASNPDITPARCLRIYRDMALIREFENMLDGIKKLGT